MADSPRINSAVSRRLVLGVALLLVALVLVTTWLGITRSRADSLLLLREQGASFTEALANSAQGALESESFFDYLVHRRFNELVVSITTQDLLGSEEKLAQFALDHSLYSITIVKADSSVAANVIVGGPRAGIPQYVFDEAYSLFGDPENNYVVLYDPGEKPGEAIHYYLQLTNDMKTVIVFSADANYFSEALKETQIDELVQRMSREAGVDYIVYQTTKGVVFSSRRVNNLTTIDADSFLVAALKQDSITSRIVDYAGSKTLELVRPFGTPDYHFGLFRVGLSLDRYFKVSRGYDLLMITLSGVLLILIVVVMLYVGGLSKRRVISQQLAQMKSISDKIFDEMRTGAAVLDASGRFVLANRAFQEISGVSDCVEKSVRDVSLPEKLGGFIQNSTGVAEEEFSGLFGGKERTLLASSSEVVLADQGSPGKVVMLNDISRLKEFERDVARKQRLSELGDLAAGVAHEIRNPLNTISIAVQRLAGEFTPPENADDYHHFVKQIREETRRLNEIISKFLALARDSGPKRTETIDLTGFLDGMISFIGPEAATLGIRLDTRVEENLQMAIDPDQLRQVMSNLFNNAKEALAGKPGTVAIRAGVVNGKLNIVVADSGPGIAEENREKVLAPYFTTKDAGTGLGLPTVHRIVTEYGGEIRIGHSQLGGAEITLEFRS